MKCFNTSTSDETIKLGEKIGKVLKEGDVVLLDGDLSAGKTTITKGIGLALGVKKIINSPTFTIVKTYSGDINLYHLDLYRLDGLNNDFDLEEYIEADGVTVIEWPHQVDELIPSEYLEIKFFKLDNDKRRIEVRGIGKKYIEKEDLL
ncbi:MAG: tRNA (adenosine(37)-N6)-threonylcarbamoyltransferase complex ATPase subunit type 1 TsaE [Acholeplasmatales bacterium]|nr:tRNA (adenosine(37)-N6)-threonylcarbamoyltransferase complex ATPase subunit type 1 TsaE [Acholeplasmatales bacterium]